MPKKTTEELTRAYKDACTVKAATAAKQKAWAAYLMSDMVVKLLKLGWQDVDIAKHLGMTAEEVLRLKQMTGLAGLFAGQPYSKAWEAIGEDAE